MMGITRKHARRLDEECEKYEIKLGFIVGREKAREISQRLWLVANGSKSRHASLLLSELNGAKSP